MFKYLKKILPSYKQALKIEMSSIIENGEFILRKTYPFAEINLHCGIEPFYPKYRGLIDFDIEGSCLVVVFNGQNPSKLQSINDYLLRSFDFCQTRSRGEKSYIFSWYRKMKFNDDRLGEHLTYLDHQLSG